MKKKFPPGTNLKLKENQLLSMFRTQRFDFQRNSRIFSAFISLTCSFCFSFHRVFWKRKRLGTSCHQAILFGFFVFFRMQGSNGNVGTNHKFYCEGHDKLAKAKQNCLVGKTLKSKKINLITTRSNCVK